MQYPAIHEKHKAIDYSDSIARLENSHLRATKECCEVCSDKMYAYFLGGPYKSFIFNSIESSKAFPRIF